MFKSNKNARVAAIENDMDKNHSKVILVMEILKLRTYSDMDILNLWFGVLAGTSVHRHLKNPDKIWVREIAASQMITC